MGKHAGNRTARAAKQRRRRHERRSAEAAAVKTWLKKHAPGALIYARPQVCLRKLMRVTMMVQASERDHWARPLNFLAPERLTISVPASYRWAGLFNEMGPMRTPKPIVYMDGI